MTEAEMYRAAADLLRRDGWCQGYYRRGKSHCIVGALVKIRTINHCPDLPALRLSTLTGYPMSSFNDAPDMTADDAIAALEIAADLAS